jgi:Spherulation-specific family 4
MRIRGRRQGTHRLGGSLGLAAALALTCLGVLPAPGFARAAHGQDQLIPLYDNANPTDWTEACSQTNGANGGSWIIADVAEGQGPGDASVPAWAQVIDNCYSYGRASVIGYVWTDYGEGGQASIASIESQIKDWYAFYPGGIAGIFFDGVSDDVPGTTTSNQSFYRTLASYVHTHERHNGEVVFNYGANPGSGWMFESGDANNADIVVTFEGSYDTPGENPYTSWTQASWERRYPADGFAALIYNAPESPATPQPASVCSALKQQNIGYVYVGTWYDQLPPYFGELLMDSAQGNC